MSKSEIKEFLEIEGTDYAITKAENFESGEDIGIVYFDKGVQTLSEIQAIVDSIKSKNIFSTLLVLPRDCYLETMTLSELKAWHRKLGNEISRLEVLNS